MNLKGSVKKFIEKNNAAAASYCSLAIAKPVPLTEAMTFIVALL
jgi:hypothetical protein